MLINCLAACAHLTITVSELQRDIGRKSSIFSYPPCIRASVRGGGFCWNSATPFGTEKLEWLGYHTVKNFEDIFIRFGATHQRDRRTDGQTPHSGNSRAMHSIRTAKIHDIAQHYT